MPTVSDQLLKHVSFSFNVLLLSVAMPKKIMKAVKKNKPQVWPASKTGKARAFMKSTTTMKKLKPVPYVRHAGVQTKFRKERVHFGVSVQGLFSMRPQALFRVLQKDGILPDWKGKE